LPVPILFLMPKGDLYRIEDELDEAWLERWLDAGLEKIEDYLAKHAAFVDYLEAAEQS
jgi:hypothetical protein